MGWRFHRSLRIIPGIRLNLSKTGTSWSIGGRGATMNIKGRRVRTTIGIPGTGISYSEQTTAPEEQPQQLMQSRGATKSNSLGFFLIVIAIAGVFAMLRWPH